MHEWRGVSTAKAGPPGRPPWRFRPVTGGRRVLLPGRNEPPRPGPREQAFCPGTPAAIPEVSIPKRFIESASWTTHLEETGMSLRIPASLARKDFALVLRQSARGERIKLTRYDKTIAVV